MEVRVCLPSWQRLRFFILFLVPPIILVSFFIYLVISTSIYGIVYPKPKPEIMKIEPATTTADIRTDERKTPNIEQPGSDTGTDHLTIAKKAFAENDFVTAYKEYKTVVANNANNLAARSQLRNIAVRTNKADDLKEFYNELIREHPEESAYYLSLGTIYMTVDRNKTKAKELFEKSLSLDPKNQAASYNLNLLKEN